MEFQPSAYSYGPDYDGWFQNVWTREGRAENKLNRAEKRRKAGKEKAAMRLEHRAAVLEAKAAGKRKSLTLKSPPGQLWRSEYPWIERPPPVGYAIGAATLGAGALEKLVEPVSKGARPPSMFALREMRSTILGGLQALQAAGVEGYSSLNLDGLSIPVLSPGKYDKTLLEFAGNAADLKEGAEFIRKEVINNKLARPAWYLRALHVIQPALISAQARQTVGSVVSLVAPPISTGFGLLISAQEAAHLALLKKKAKDYTEKAQTALGKRGLREAAQQVKAQIQLSRQIAAQESAALTAQAETEAQDLADTIKIGSYALLALALGGLAVVVIRRNQA